jgi:hypothetical protein
MTIVVEKFRTERAPTGTIEVCNICGFTLEGCVEHANLRTGSRRYVTRLARGYKNPKETKHNPANFPNMGRRSF